MSFVHLGNGISFAYLDSGAPTHGSKYSTVFTLHGLAFESGVFSDLFPLAAPAGIRIISIARRGYTGSTPFTPHEIDVLRHGDDTSRSSFLHQQGADLASLIATLIRTLNLPAEGELAVLSWSLGNVWAHAFLASIDEIPVRDREILQAYVSRIVFLDPASQGLGIADPSDSWNPYKDPHYPPADGLKHTSGFFTHDLPGRVLEYRKWDSDPSPTTDRLLPADLARLLNPEAAGYDGLLAVPAFEQPLQSLARKALLAAVPKSWPRLQSTVYVVYGERTLWMAIYGLWILEDWAIASALFSVKAHPLSGCNHFMMKDSPQQTIAALDRILTARG